MSGNNELQPLLTLKEVAAILHVHVNTVRRWSDKGVIKALQINRRGDRRFRRQDISDFLNRMNPEDLKEPFASLRL